MKVEFSISQYSYESKMKYIPYVLARLEGNEI